MNWKSQTLYIVILGALCIVSCDSFEDDALPQGEEQLQLDGALSTLPNTDLFIDLKSRINTNEIVKFQIATHPEKGTAEITEAALLHYKPKEDFHSGTDQLTVDMINTDGVLLDTDTIGISISSDTTDIPCFNGALTDYYEGYQGQPIYMNLLANDGYCPDQTKEVVVEVISELENGSLSQSDHNDFVYLPDSGFVGSESFMYELELVDMDDESHFSVGQVNIEILEEPDTLGSACDGVVVPFDYVVYTDSLQQYYDILPFIPQPACDILDWSIDLYNVTLGNAEVTDDGLIRYYPVLKEDSSAYTSLIEYGITFLDQSVDNYISVNVMAGAGGPDTTSCPDAKDDAYYFYIAADSAGAEQPMMMTPLENDVFCSDAFEFDLLTEPDFGEIEVTQENQLIMTVEEEFAGLKKTMVEYLLCDSGACDTATVFIEVEQ